MPLSIPKRMTQVVTRIDDQLVATIDALVADGTVASRSEAVREALAAWVDARQRAARRARDEEAYKRVPDTDDELAWADANGRAMVEEEPWRRWDPTHGRWIDVT